MSLSSRKMNTGHSPHAQRGAILVVSLMLLLVLTIIGVSSMQGTALEESMSYATRDRTIALQSAEAGLREAEAWIEAVASPAALTGSNGLYRRADTIPYYNTPATWLDANTSNYVTATAPTGSSSAKYIVKELGLVSGTQGSMNLTGYGENKGSGDVTTFQVTSRGTGGAATGAEVILRSNYGRQF
ncbi:MAG: PilX N-terminal domain-containing pilus assembly protein [Gammaproteobacteria bacterium]|nr:PilX N-terminal domain-containing pilus assembly protein [Gammaproteobacteria bacterium]MDH5515253.1 PilX N-terminal domain-containing pilus assembly protein [Gammaproteobacteria bacterium]